MSFTMFLGRTDGGSSKRTILLSPSVFSNPTEVRWPNSNIRRYQITDKSTADNPVEVTVATQIIFHHVPLECRRGSFKPGATVADMEVHRGGVINHRVLH